MPTSYPWRDKLRSKGDNHKDTQRWHPINDQQIWADAVTRLKVGSGRAFSASNLGSLVADLRSILDPQCIARAGEVAAQMTKPAVSVASAADLVEDAGHLGRIGA